MAENKTKKFLKGGGGLVRRGFVDTTARREKKINIKRRERGKRKKKKREKAPRHLFTTYSPAGDGCCTRETYIPLSESNLVALNSPDNHNKIIGYGAPS